VIDDARRWQDEQAKKVRLDLARIRIESAPPVQESFSFVTRMTWTDPKDGAEWCIQVKNGDVEFSCLEDDPEGGWGKKETGNLVMPKEAFVRLCPAMARVIEGAYA
jgi:hypothetical protein